MKSRSILPLRRALLVLAAALACFGCSSLQLTYDRDAERDEDGTSCAACGDCKNKAEVCKKPTMMALAHDLDDLEEHIDKFGSVVAKQPDVWGQARLQKHREDVETTLAAELTKFSDTLQGSLSRSDQEYLGEAVALGIAASGTPAGLSPLPPVLVRNGTTTTAVNQTVLPVPSTSTLPADVTLGRPDLPKALALVPAVTTLSLEPNVHLDQLNSYLQHLNQLRRNNEGDDTADSPGYSLNLVRIPVSVLPGKRTEKGHGAEVTMTLTPYLSDELLPTTFRNLVMNDLIDQLGLPLTEALNDCCIQTKYGISGCTPEDLGKDCGGDKKVEKTDEKAPKRNAVKYVMQKRGRYPVRVTKLRRGLMPFTPSQLYEVYGDEPIFQAVDEAFGVFHDKLASTPIVHYPDVQSYLGEEINGAYRLLAEPNNAHLWCYCTPQLAEDVRTHRAEALCKTRTEFLTKVKEAANPGAADPKFANETALGLTWAIIVESALLNEQLVKDMKETAASKGCSCEPGNWQPYFLPLPPPEARQAFNEYVRCRWPIHVFALDPVTTEQNIADQFTSTREMQLALSIAFVSGKINANSLTRYARRIETDADTIALNNTAVGFSHGNETFGWRFYPRFQTPDIESNAQVIFQDNLIGGPTKDSLLMQRRLEPGTRECTAVVIMPSFVPYASLDVSSNWFNLTDPKCKVLKTAQAMRMSRAVKAIKTCGPNVGDADCYRDGDLWRLNRKAEQLEARLPLQSTMVQVPYENTLGGFSMFNTGVTDLAPELDGWYGASYLNTDAATTVFLVGNHFSVHATKVVAGGVEVSASEMLSRQVMKVVIPAGAQTVPGPALDATGKACTGTAFYVDVNLATPYGVTSHLFIPAITSKPAKAAAGLSWGKDGQVDLAYVYSGVGIAPSSAPYSRPPSIQVTAKDKTVQDGPAQLTLIFPDKEKVPLPTTVTFKDGKATVLGTDLTAVFNKFGAVFGEQTNPPQSEPVAVVSIQPLDKLNKPTGNPVTLDTNLNINWVFAPK